MLVSPAMLAEAALFAEQPKLQSPTSSRVEERVVPAVGLEPTT